MKKFNQYMKAMGACLCMSMLTAILAFVPEGNLQIANSFLKGFGKEV